MVVLRHQKDTLFFISSTTFGYISKYDENGPYIWYQTDTEPGASGSPVFNNSWDVVALHHSGVPRIIKSNGVDVWATKDGKPWTNAMGADQIDWIANEGVRISRIVQFLQSQHPGHPITQAILAAKPWDGPEGSSTGDGPMEGIRIEHTASGRTRILVPIEIGVSIPLPQVPPPPPSNSPYVPALPAGGPRMVESVDVDQSNYDKRNGFNPKFLGSGLIVPLPKLTTTAAKSALKVGGSTELTYWNYSAVLNFQRKLAFYSAANIDTSKWLGNRDADGDKWFSDTRVEAAKKGVQLDQRFYGKQKEFEASRALNPFDRGHLTRRRDLQWGPTLEEAKRNGDDSYHFTNCAPQHWQFNQDQKASGIWFRLEESAVSTLSKGAKLCLINGPVFDGPLCIPGEGGRLHLNPSGKRVKDATFGGVAIPKQFFKVIAYVVDGELRSKAFVVTQEDLLATVDRIRETAEKLPSILSDVEVRLYQVAIKDLEALTGLDFGSLKQTDTLGLEAFAGKPGPIEDVAQIRF